MNDVLCQYHGKLAGIVNGMADAEATSVLYGKLAEQFGTPADEEHQKVFAATPLVYSVKKDTPITKPQKERLYRLIAQHNLTVDYDVEKLTRSEASRYTDKIYEKYGR